MAESKSIRANDVIIALFSRKKKRNIYGIAIR